MEEYLKSVLEQIRCQKAHAMIEQELRGHMEDQIEAYSQEGMDVEEAERMAVRDMGDPVQNGVSLDLVHRPKMAWDLVILVGLLALAGILLHKSLSFTICTMAGFALMLAVYRLDYSFLAKYGTWMMAAVLLLTMAVGEPE